jgi:hypothetical protein
MRNKLFFLTFAVCAALTAFASDGLAEPVIRTAAGANSAGIIDTVNQFRADLGGNQNPNNTNSFQTGRREINWDGVPEAFSSPNNLPANFFNANSPRGAVFTTPCGNATFRVSANAVNSTQTPVRFGEIDFSYAFTFTTFSAQKLFTVISDPATPCNITEVKFFIPGSSIPATTKGFGVVFTDVDAEGAAKLLAYDKAGRLLGSVAATPFSGGLSFVGISFTGENERIASVQIVSGNARLAQGNIDGKATDVVAMDDFIYGEPRAAESHPSDFDGTADLVVFRPEAGSWFLLFSGTNAFASRSFGTVGDIPVDGDTDGDSKNDFIVYRPSSGTWFVSRSADGQFSATQFGATGDRPVMADYDRDGRSDIAVWRPSEGTYFVLRSSNGQFRSTQFGTAGDLPLGAAVAP